MYSVWFNFDFISILCDLFWFLENEKQSLFWTVFHNRFQVLLQPLNSKEFLIELKNFSVHSYVTVCLGIFLKIFSCSSVLTGSFTLPFSHICSCSIHNSLPEVRMNWLTYRADIDFISPVGNTNQRMGHTMAPGYNRGGITCLGGVKIPISR
jgi:hypothetical protein